MNLLRFVPIKLTLLLVLGIFLGRYLQLSLFFSLVLIGTSLALLGIRFYREGRSGSQDRQGRGSPMFGIAVTLTTIGIGLLAVSLADARNISDHYSHKYFKGNRLWEIKIYEELKSTQYSDRYLARATHLDSKIVSGSILMVVPKKVLSKKKSRPAENVRQPSSPPTEEAPKKRATSNRETKSHKAATRLKVDDEIIVFAGMDAINPPLNPHQFDYREYMENLGITDQLRLQNGLYYKRKSPERTVYGIAASIRNRIITMLKNANFGREELSIIQALLLGRRSDISAETYENYKDAGAVHILAVSGLHIGILLLLLQLLLRPLERLPKGKTLKLILIVGLLWAFAVLAGLSASVVRSVTMFSFVAYALYLNRPGNTFNILALSMFFILLLVDPLLLFQVGFQMSYAAVFAIVWIYPLLQRLWNPKNRVVRYFWQLLSVSIAAQAGVLPISLFYFHQFPGLFFISNLLIVPALGVILGMGILTIILALIGHLPEWMVLVYDTLIRWMNLIIARVAEQEAFVFRNISFDEIQLVLAYGILLCLILFLSRPNFKKAVALALMVIGFQMWLFRTSYSSHQKEVLLIAHQTRNSVLMHRQGNHLNVISQKNGQTERMTADYQVAERILSIGHAPLANGYRFRDKKLLIIDSLEIYPTGGPQPDHLLLSGSPKLNLERLIDSIRPKNIIADGSNYRSFIGRWKKTCAERDLPFHYTGERGAYYFEEIKP